MSRVGVNARLSGACYYIIGADAKLADRVNSSRLAYPFFEACRSFFFPSETTSCSRYNNPSLRNLVHTLEPKSVLGNLDVCQSWDMLKKNVGPAVGGKDAQVANGSGSWRLEAARDGRMWM